MVIPHYRTKEAHIYRSLATAVALVMLIMHVMNEGGEKVTSVKSVT